MDYVPFSSTANESLYVHLSEILAYLIVIICLFAHLPNLTLLPLRQRPIFFVFEGLKNVSDNCI